MAQDRRDKRRIVEKEGGRGGGGGACEQRLLLRKHQAHEQVPWTGQPRRRAQKEERRGFGVGVGGLSAFGSVSMRARTVQACRYVGMHICVDAIGACG